ncbi:MAG: hypothetical protein R2799_07705 [Crocinitomicaceae bacterium]
MKKGVLDIGSNTIKFKIFEGDQLILFHTYPTQIGTGLKDGLLSKEILIRIEECFNEVAQVLVDHHAVLSRVIATSAVRDAQNSIEVEKVVGSLFGKTVEIIPGNQEAEFIYKGVRKGIFTDDPYLICDIGGGAVELIYCTNQKIIKAFSFEAGVIKLFNLRKNRDPLDEEDVQFYMNYLECTMGEFLRDVHTNYLVGAAGSFESLYTLARNKEYSGDFEDLAMKELNHVLHSILIGTQMERDEDERIPFERKILLPLGAILVIYLINKLEINKFTVSPNSLIEGLDL